MGLHRVVAPAGVLPQAAEVLDTRAELWPGEVRIDVDRLNLDAASARQLRESNDHDPDRVRAAVLAVVRSRGKMHNPVTGSGGMLLGTVAEVGPESPLGLQVGQRVATLVSLTLTPLHLSDDLSAGTARGSRCRRAATPCSSPAASPPSSRTTWTSPTCSRSWTCAAPPPWWPASSPSGTRAGSVPTSPCSARPASRGRCRWPRRGTPGPAAWSGWSRSPARPRR